MVSLPDRIWLQEANREDEGFLIKDGIIVVTKGAWKHALTFSITTPHITAHCNCPIAQQLV